MSILLLLFCCLFGPGSSSETNNVPIELIFNFTVGSCSIANESPVVSLRGECTGCPEQDLICRAFTSECRLHGVLVKVETKRNQTQKEMPKQQSPNVVRLCNLCSKGWVRVQCSFFSLESTLVML